jgi:hypothetical protein
MKLHAVVSLIHLLFAAIALVASFHLARVALSPTPGP